LRKDVPELVEKIRELLLCPIVYSDTGGVFLLEEFCRLPDGRLAYNPDRIRATDTTTALYHLLRDADKIKVSAGNKSGLFFYQENRLVGQADSNVRCLTFAKVPGKPYWPSVQRS
jgi:hypothetical protein